MTTSQTQTDVDTLVTLAVVELLTSPEYGTAWLTELAENFGIELTETQAAYLDETVGRTLDQLAIPFVDSLPEELGAAYQETLEARAGA